MPSGAKYFQPAPSVILQRISNFNCRRIIDMLAQFARAELNYPLTIQTNSIHVFNVTNLIAQIKTLNKIRKDLF